MHSHNIHSLATVNYPTSPRRNSLPPSSHQYSGNIRRLSINNPKIFKDFFACRIVLAANHQQPGNIQRPSGNQQQQSTAATSNSNQQQQPTAATSSSNQQQQPALAISSSNQQQQSAAATSNSNQQQRPAAATSISNQHSSYQQHLHNQRRPPLVITTVPSERYISCPVAECHHRTAANFCDFSTCLKFPFYDSFSFFPKT